MNDIPIILAVEDVLSEAVMKRILVSTDKSYNVSLTLSRHGNQYLKSKAASFNDTANGFPVVMLTDQDLQARCAPLLIRDWLNQAAKHANFVFRVAVLEVEAWLLADRSNLASFLQVPIARIPQHVEEIAHPKKFLVNLARSSLSRAIRDDIVPRGAGTAKVGRNYNGRLIEFVTDIWDVPAAARNCDSLSRAFRRLSNFEPVHFGLE